MVNLLLAIIISEFNQIRLTNIKLKAIENIKYQIDKGKTIKRAIELVLGVDFYEKLLKDEECRNQFLKRVANVSDDSPNEKLSISSWSENESKNPFDYIRSGYSLVDKNDNYINGIQVPGTYKSQRRSSPGKFILLNIIL